MRHEDVVIPAGEKVPDQQEWEAAGRPHLWIHLVKEGEFEFQADCAYGAYRTMRNGVEVHRGKDFTYFENTLLYLGDSYGELCGLFKRVK